MHINFELLLRAGILAINTVAEPGAHGATVLGTQGPGVKTGPFQLVGFAVELHTPKGMMLAIGLLSIIVAAGWFEVITLLAGNTTSVPGAAPKVHIIDAPLHTTIPIEGLL
jgi:hypothetical protein